jgi:hypothetical protein
MAKLHSQHHAFEGPKREKRQQANQGQPDHDLDPDRRLKGYLGK